MTALSADRNTTRRLQERFSDPVEANKKIYQGSIVVLNAAGNAEPATTALAKVARGIASARADNTGAGAGAINVETEAGDRAYHVANDGTITRAHIGTDCYLVDDQTVAHADGGGTRSLAGRIVDVDSTGVWIKFYQ